MAVLLCIVRLITVGVHEAYPNKITWLPKLTPYNQTLPKRGCFIEQMKLGKLPRKYTEKLTRCKIFYSKSDACSKSWFKIWNVVKTFIQNLTRWRNFDSKSEETKNFSVEFILSTKTFSFKIMLFRKNFTIKIMLLRNVFFSKTCFLKLYLKRKVWAFYGVNWIMTWFFCVQKIFQKLIFFKKNSSKS